jgi:hypothetical protein
MMGALVCTIGRRRFGAEPISVLGRHFRTASG